MFDTCKLDTVSKKYLFQTNLFDKYNFNSRRFFGAHQPYDEDAQSG